MEEIRSNELCVKVLPEKGGKLTSIIFKGKECQYQADDGVWPQQDVVIFPLAGKNIFVYKGKTYEIPARHGLLREGEMDVYSKKNDEVTLIFKSNEESKKVYPFDFELFITYKVEGNKLSEVAEIKNLGNENMYFSFGSHLAFLVDPKTSYLNFNEDKLTLFPLENGLIKVEDPIDIKLNDNKLELNKEFFKKYDTAVFVNEDNGYELVTGNNNIKIKYVHDAPLFASWSNANSGNFVCNEPWWAISNYTNEVLDISKIKYINELEPNKTKKFVISYEFND